MAAEEKKNTKQDKEKKLNQEQIINGFNQLRQEQRALVAKLAELELELSEHNLVADALKEVPEGRKCFRMIGGVLVERTVKEVLPAVLNNRDQLEKAIENLKEQIASKGTELNSFKEKYSIQVQESASIPVQEQASMPVSSKEEEDSKIAPSVLVENKA
ncbi:prefoldin subunit 2 [Centruroides vittatus]|uniref:prefoldin subunit 2-like n=1 Tax=Centruroides sculpturatus TaxID=218467 RepID=UPI000C6D0EAF|nr:prefoldin subunit 2-like [Centruroides sculpturatus]